MREDLLQFIWRFQYFNLSDLFTEAGEALQIIFPGELNTGQGPDFRNARIRIGDVLLEGAVELHVAASDWGRHGHDGDPNYQAVILHVVWEDDGKSPDIPVLVLQHRVSKLLLGQYGRWMKSRSFVPCASQLQQVDVLTWTGWKERLLQQRLHRRALVIRDWLEANRQHWEEVTWWQMARSMGLPVNGDAFEAIARSVPFRLLARHRDEPVRTRALLLGQAGLSMTEGMRQEYLFLRWRHRLQPVGEMLSFLRMRPAHFPSRRLVQLAELFSTGESWFARIKEAASPDDLDRWLDVKGLGAGMKRGLVVNAFIPVLYAYGLLRGEPVYQQKALDWLRKERPEINRPVAEWQRLGVIVDSAADSQSLLELKKHYCDGRRCLDCAIGRALLNPA